MYRREHYDNWSYCYILNDNCVLCMDNYHGWNTGSTARFLMIIAFFAWIIIMVGMMLWHDYATYKLELQKKQVCKPKRESQTKEIVVLPST